MLRGGWCSFLFVALALAAGAQGSDQLKTFKWPGDDWLNDFSWETFAQLKQSPIAPCSRLGPYLRIGDNRTTYYILRDAGIFLDKTCRTHIAPLRAELAAGEFSSLGLHFYEARFSNSGALQALLREFDAHAISKIDGRQQSNDSLVVELFGFLPEWEETLPRLLEHHKHADGAAATMSHDALDWKRHLFGSGTPQAAACRAAAAKLQLAEAESRNICGPT